MLRLVPLMFLLVIACSATAECREVPRLATTTSTAENGLLDLLTAQFEKERGDDSGTHAAERRLWQAADILPNPQKFRYIEAGQGMSTVLRMTDELKGYTLTDRATYEKLRPTLTLQILVEGDSRLFNRYSLITANPKKHPKARRAAAQAFIDWLTGPAGRALIGKFVGGGRPVFFLDGGK